MGKILIRYIHCEHADSYLNGDLYLSSLSTFRDFLKNKVPYEDLQSGKATAEDLAKAIEYDKLNQQDMSEGLYSQVPYNKVPFIKNSEIFNGHVINDVRFRLEAYGYCNLLCFYRVDYASLYDRVSIDEENIAFFAAKKGINFSKEYLRDNSFLETLLKTLFSNDCISKKSLIEAPINIIHLPPKEMDGFGNMVVIIKDEREFIRRVIKAVRKQGGNCVIGDVKYHKMQDRVNLDMFGKRHSITLISQELRKISTLIDNNGDDVIKYGCLDKYEKFNDQKEWRVCWLPKVFNNEAKILSVGNLSDIIEIVPADTIRERLLELCPGYIPGILDYDEQKVHGTVNYKKFKKLVEQIDGKCQVIMEIG